MRVAVQVSTPPTEAIVSAYLALGLHVDLFTPNPGASIEGRGQFTTGVAMHDFDYGKRWTARNLPRLVAKRYAVVSATTEDPVVFAATLATFSRCPFIVSADEIFSGSYWGNASERWKRWCRGAMRRADLTIVNDPSRERLQREYAELPPDRQVLVYPNCLHEPPPPADRERLRAQLGIPSEAFVLVASGQFDVLNCADWLVRSMRHLPGDVHLLLQPGDPNPLLLTLYQELRESHRIHVVPKRLTFRESWASMSCADAGFVGYRHTGPQFQNMGVSSTRLCMFLQTGLPVVALRQDSFRFIEDYGCGVLIDAEADVPAAVQSVRSRRDAMSQRAREALHSVGQQETRRRQLFDSIRRLI